MKRLLLALAWLSMPVASQAQEVVSNATLGIQVAKPAAWHVLTAEANAENLRRVEMNDRQLRDAIAKYATAPLIAFSKFEEPYDDLNPSFKVNVRPQGNLAGRSAVEILSLIMPTLETAFDEVVVEQRPVAAIVGGQPAAYMRLNYMLHAGEQAFPTTSELWIVPRGSYFFMIGAGSRRDETNGKRSEIKEIVDSISFAR